MAKMTEFAQFALMPYAEYLRHQSFWCDACRDSFYMSEELRDEIDSTEGVLMGGELAELPAGSSYPIYKKIRVIRCCPICAPGQFRWGEYLHGLFGNDEREGASEKVRFNNV